MGWLRSIAREVWGLFVDDGSFAAAIVVWLALTLLVLPRIGVSARAAGPALFAGLAAILAESVLRASHRPSK